MLACLFCFSFWTALNRVHLVLAFNAFFFSIPFFFLLRAANMLSFFFFLLSSFHLTCFAAYPSLQATKCSFFFFFSVICCCWRKIDEPRRSRLSHTCCKGKKRKVKTKKGGKKKSLNISIVFQMLSVASCSPFVVFFFFVCVPLFIYHVRSVL